ncbi:hypothetical protein FA13DRAFT_1741488 [Coprinellus micaceus]|uniref:Uncharacterized protein n=1 Tax=Coprinellus micaceus TaxID=71717 RepID=A0A4Y7SJ50_COPMI|nr:hypothetical protein FA13DRAFT_1741488 [Coprinellus micaceus]
MDERPRLLLLGNLRRRKPRDQSRMDEQGPPSHALYSSALPNMFSCPDYHPSARPSISRRLTPPSQPNRHLCTQMASSHTDRHLQNSLARTPVSSAMLTALWSF